MKRILHWLGHVLFDMDCGVRMVGSRMFCKKCGRDVSLPEQEP